jgi:protein phosphatase 1 regulatory subunit 11
VASAALGVGVSASRRGALTARAPDRAHITWCDDVVDNEGLGKKSSKSCCVYHKPRAFDESSDESDYEPDQRDYNFFPPAPGASGASGSGAAASSSAPASSSA